MGFLVFLQHQEHHSLCNQACRKVVGSEYIVFAFGATSELLKDCSEQADKHELGQKSENKNEDNPGEVGIRVLKHDCSF